MAGEDFDDVAITIARREIHVAVNIGRLAAQCLLDQAERLDELLPIDRAEQTQTRDAVANRNLIRSLALIKFRLATASRVCVCLARSIGRNSSRRLAWSSKHCAASRPMFTATWISRRAIVIATSSKRSPAIVPSRKSKWRPKPLSWRRKVRNKKAGKIAPRTSVFI